MILNADVSVRANLAMLFYKINGVSSTMSTTELKSVTKFSGNVENTAKLDVWQRLQPMGSTC